MWHSTEKPHGKTGDSIISQTAAWCHGRLRSWTDFLLEKGEGAHQRSRVPGSRSWHTQCPWRGHPSNPGLWQHLLFLLFTISLRAIQCYLWSFNNCCVVVLQEQSLFSPGGANCPYWGMQEEGWNASPALPVSLQRNHTDNGTPQQPSSQGQLKWRSSTKGPFFSVPESIWLLPNMLQSQSGLPNYHSTQLAAASPISPLPHWPTCLLEKLGNQLCHLHSQERIFILC